ncbi:MAG: histidine kinase dimerization/phospho-acceptor domain-containing protein [Cyanobacteria bacterium J06649_4]
MARTSHEMRSPINTIVSLHQLILEDLCEGPEEEKEFIAQSKEAALKMLALFDQLTAVSKLDVGREPPKLESVDLSFLLPEVEMLTTLQAANQNVRYTVESPADELEIHTDAKWLKNILTSLLQDAIAHTKFLSLAVVHTPPNITIEIECDRTADSLQSQLAQLSETLDYPNTAPAKTDILKQDIKQDIKQTAAEDIRLSTGLILATAHTALPLINGQFCIAAHPDDSTRSRIQCVFSE